MQDVKIERERAFAISSIKQCGHCYRGSTWLIESITSSGGIWNDYECEDHAKQWWPHLFPAS